MKAVDAAHLLTGWSMKKEIAELLLSSLQRPAPAGTER
jgi:hypothetical protein